MAEVQKMFSHIDSKQQEYVEDLKQVIAIPSMSADPKKWPDVFKAMEWFGGRLQKLGVVVEYFDLIELHDTDGNAIKCPQVMTATISKQQNKKNILVYGHVDVAVAKMAEGWTRCPFQLTEENGYLHGRGTCDNKGPLLYWLHAIEAFVALNVCPPVNIKLVVEGMYENGSMGLAQFCAEKKDLFENVDCVCITNSTWLDVTKPCIVYGQRGICYFLLEVDGIDRDICSKQYGGAVNEPLVDLLFLLDSLQDTHRKICVPGIMDDLQEPSEKEQKAYRAVNLDVAAMKKRIGAQRLAHSEIDSRILMHRWRLPALVIHGIEGGYNGKGERMIIPGKVVGKFSIQIVENQNPDVIRQQVSSHLESLWKARGSPNAVKLQMTHSSPAVLGDPQDGCFQAAQRAARQTYDVDPEMIRQGHTVPIAHALKELTGAQVVMLCAGDADSNMQAPNENVSVQNFMKGHKLVMSFMYELASK